MTTNPKAASGREHFHWMQWMGSVVGQPPIKIANPWLRITYCDRDPVRRLTLTTTLGTATMGNDNIILHDKGQNNNHDGDDTDDDDFDEKEDASCEVELGFVGEDRPHLSGPYMEWDGGKVGGQPVWLHPNADVSITCSSCGNHMSFLLQIYCPVDEVPDAYHRSIYVYCCRILDCPRLGQYVRSYIRCRIVHQ
jgi:hypothetical protein